MEGYRLKLHCPFDQAVKRKLIWSSCETETHFKDPAEIQVEN